MSKNLKRLKINNIVQPSTEITLHNLQMNTTSAHAMEPKNEIVPINVTAVIGIVEKLNNVSETKRIFFFNVHLLVPISLARRV